MLHERSGPHSVSDLCMTWLKRLTGHNNDVVLFIHDFGLNSYCNGIRSHHPELCATKTKVTVSFVCLFCFLFDVIIPFVYFLYWLLNVMIPCGPVIRAFSSQPSSSHVVNIYSHTAHLGLVMKNSPCWSASNEQRVLGCCWICLWLKCYNIKNTQCVYEAFRVVKCARVVVLTGGEQIVLWGCCCSYGSCRTIDVEIF